MVSFCPLDEEDDRLLPPRHAPPPPPPSRQEVARRAEETECNFVVMFFIVGSIALALSDSVR